MQKEDEDEDEDADQVQVFQVQDKNRKHVELIDFPAYDIFPLTNFRPSETSPATVR